MAGTITINTPAGDDGDIMIAFVAAGHVDDFSGDSEINPDDLGWTLLRRSSIDLGADAGIRLGIWWRLATSGDPGSFDFSWVTPVASSYGGHIGRWSRPSASDPIMADAAVVVQPAADPLVIAAPSLVAELPLPIMVVMHLANAETDEGVGPWSVPAGMAQRAENDTIAAVVPLDIQVCDEQITAVGATGTRSATFDGPDEYTGMAYSVLIRPDCWLPPN